MNSAVHEKRNDKLIGLQEQKKRIKVLNLSGDNVAVSRSCPLKQKNPSCAKGSKFMYRIGYFGSICKLYLNMTCL